MIEAYRQLFLNQFCSDGIDEGASVVDEDEPVSFDPCEFFICQCTSAGDTVWAEEVKGNAIFGAQAEGDAFEATGFVVEVL